MPVTVSLILLVLSAMQQTHKPACSYTSYRRSCEVPVTHFQSLCGFVYDIHANRVAAEMASYIGPELFG